MSLCSGPPDLQLCFQHSREGNIWEVLQSGLIHKGCFQIHHVSTTLLSKADSTNDFIALSQPVAVQNTDESLIPVVDPAPVVGPIVPIVEPVILYFTASLVDPLIPNDSHIIKPLVPYAEHVCPSG